MFYLWWLSTLALVALFFFFLLADTPPYDFELEARPTVLRVFLKDGR